MPSILRLPTLKEVKGISYAELIRCTRSALFQWMGAAKRGDYSADLAETFKRYALERRNRIEIVSHRTSQRSVRYFEQSPIKNR